MATESLQVLFFAKLAEEMGVRALDVPYSAGVDTVEKLIAYLVAENEQWAAAFAQNQVLSSVNHEMTKHDATLLAGDEVGLFPPVTGG